MQTYGSLILLEMGRVFKALYLEGAKNTQGGEDNEN